MMVQVKNTDALNILMKLIVFYSAFFFSSVHTALFSLRQIFCFMQGAHCRISEIAVRRNQKDVEIKHDLFQDLI